MGTCTSDAANNLTLGTNDSGSRHHSGYIDDFRMYNRALTESEIQSLYAMGAPVGSSTALPQGCPNVGDICDDGTVYLGLAPDDGTTPLYGWNARAPSTLPWNNGNLTGIVDTEAIITNQNGEDTTNTLVIVDADSDTGGFQPFQAMTYCYNLQVSGADDWALPSWGELDRWLLNAPYSFETQGDSYWTVDDRGPGSSNWVSRLRLDTNLAVATGGNPPASLFYVTCVRRGQAPRCANPYGLEGSMFYNTTHDVMQYCDGARWVAIGKQN